MTSSDSMRRLRDLLDEADAVVVGAGAGLSTSAGLVYTGRRFEDNFADFIRKYGIRDMYSGGFLPFDGPEEYWAYWSRYVFINRYADDGTATYARLLDLLRGRDYFVLTTNVDHQFQKAGFDKGRLFYTQGDYGLFQCGVPCHERTYDNETAIRAMVEQQTGMRIPTELIPHCPVCGEPMTMNLRVDGTFVQDDGWHQASDRYDDFLHAHQGRRLLFLELGVGMNTPGIIKYPFWRMTFDNPNASYACINFGEAFVPAEIRRRSVAIDDDIDHVLRLLLGSQA